jgi:dihydropteroate synthase
LHASDGASRWSPWSRLQNINRPETTLDAHELASWLTFSGQRPPLVMGVLNVTPDSFSDGGRFAQVESAAEHGLSMAAQGADWIDIGGESTRPGSQRIEPAEQIRRTVPVISALRARGLKSVISIDTTRSSVAEAALDAGADVVNDISAGRDCPGMLPVVARRGVPVILMHMQGTPETMQRAPSYHDVTGEVAAFLRQRLDAAVEAGVDPRQVLLDPGIGFGKTMEHNLELLRRLDELTALDRPLVLGVSRKRFIGTITGEAEASRRLFGTAACVAWCLANGAAVVRVHDVEAMVQVTRMTVAIRRAGGR